MNFLRARLAFLSVVALPVVHAACAPPVDAEARGSTSSRSERRSEAGSLDACDESDSLEALPTAQRYLSALVTRIASASPKTFRDGLARDKLCVVVTDDARANGHADPFSGKVSIGRGVIELAANDAQVASIVSHELAHITRRHGVWEKEHGFDDPFIRIHPRLREDDAWLAAHRADDASGMKRAASRLLSAGESANWAEADADAAGLLLYLRAGFSIAEFAWDHVADLEESRSVGTAKSDSSDLAPCLRRIARGEEPPRGLDVHPTSCWRVYNVRVTERARIEASADRALLDNDATTLDLSPSFAEARAEALAAPAREDTSSSKASSESESIEEGPGE